MNMILTAITVMFSVFFGVMLAAGVLYVIIKRQIERLIRDFVTSPGQNTPSPFASLVSQIAGVVGGSVAASLKAVFLGVQSVESKNARAMESEMIAGQSPILGAIMTSFPAVAKRLAKNPQLAGLALEVAGKVFSKSKGGAPMEAPVQYKFS